jgi:hypothetical protein
VADKNRGSLSFIWRTSNVQAKLGPLPDWLSDMNTTSKDSERMQDSLSEI